MTPHISAEKGKIAKTVIMPGDPLRAKMIAEKYLSDYELVSSVRGIYAYTGYYNNKQVTVMASGMGNPSMGIYSYELFNFYDVDSIIRVGSCGAYTKDLNLYDLILVEKSYSTSTYAFNQNGFEGSIIESSVELNDKIKASTTEHLNVGMIHCSDVFYKNENNFKQLFEMGCLAVEMETFALFHNAKVLNKKAACILTVSDNLETKEETSSLERQNSFTKMIEVALNSL